MWFHIDPQAGVPIYLQIGNQVRQAVALGVVQPGEQLPTVRELAAQLTVNPNTVAKAYQELEREGVIQTARGKGTFIADRPADGAKAERLEHLGQALDRLIVDARYLQISPSELRALFEARLSHWLPEGEADD